MAICKPLGRLHVLMCMVDKVTLMDDAERLHVLRMAFEMVDESEVAMSASQSLLMVKFRHRPQDGYIKLTSVCP